jgi:hypothetical protein
MRETSRQQRAFDLYWGLGPDRTIERLRAALHAVGTGPSQRTLFEWSRRLHWQHRIAQFERDARLAADAARVQALREMAERHTKEALLLQQKGAEWISGLDDDHVTADGAIRALVEGVRMERLARGEATEKREISGELEIRPQLKELTDEQLDDLIDLVERGVARIPPPASE